MKKLALSAALILGFIFYGLQQRKEENMPVTLAATPVPPPSETPLPTPDPATILPTSTPLPTPTPTPTFQGRYKDGSYIGSVADAFYGNLQVKAIIKGGKISEVQFLQYPNDHPHSREINSQAMPLLTQEAIQTQSAQVDIVSGATDSSQAFGRSLAYALNQAS